MATDGRILACVQTSPDDGVTALPVGKLIPPNCANQLAAIEDGRAVAVPVQLPDGIHKGDIIGDDWNGYEREAPSLTKGFRYSAGDVMVDPSYFHKVLICSDFEEGLRVAVLPDKLAFYVSSAAFLLMGMRSVIIEQQWTWDLINGGFRLFTAPQK